MFYTRIDGADRPGARVTFTGEEASHLARSLRARPGERVLAGDGRGTLCEVLLEAVDRHQVAGVVTSVEHVPRESPGITVFQAVGRSAKMDEALAGASEAGVALFVPFVSERSPAGSLGRAEERLERWRRIAAEASMVARRPWLMEVAGALSRTPGPGELAGRGRSILLWEGENSISLSEALPEEPPEELRLLVGPEGGFSEREAVELASAGVVPASMGGLILRTQTAGAYAAMIARFRYGRLSPFAGGWNPKGGCGGD